MKLRFAILPAIVLLLFTACSPPEQAASVPPRPPGIPAYGDSLVEGTIGEPSTLIPLLASDASSHAVAGLVYNGLVKYDKELQLVGDLAERWDVSPDGL